MKIYPNSSNIMVTNSVNVLTDIPLSYIDTNKLEYKINTIINAEYKNKIKQEVLPYEKMNKNTICLFDKYGNKIDSVELVKHLKRENSDYVFVPYGSTTFAPKIFEYNVTAKKNIIYNSKMQYNINVAVNKEMLANALMPIFGDASTKGLAPSNILINNGSMSYSDLITSSTKNKDILFMISDEINNDDLYVEIEQGIHDKAISEGFDDRIQIIRKMVRLTKFGIAFADVCIEDSFRSNSLEIRK